MNQSCGGFDFAGGSGGSSAGRRGIVRQPEETNCKQIESKIKIENPKGVPKWTENSAPIDC